MTNLLEVIFLGIVEGITEFLPISSTGHLLLVQGLGLTAPRSEAFNVVIQLGAISAVVVIYWRRLYNLAVGFLEPENFDYILKLGVSFIVTMIGVLICRKLLNWELPETVLPVAMALFIGGLIMFLAEWHLSRHEATDKLTWVIAIGVGLAQVLAAVFPGTSRSMATIFAAMLCGQNRQGATEFSFLVGIPTMFAASVYSLYEEFKDGGLSTANSEVIDIIIGFIVSAIVAFVVVKWLLSYVRSHSFNPFAWYRIILSLFLFAALYAGWIANDPYGNQPDLPKSEVPTVADEIWGRG